ncbi:MAG TPA: ABC transporter permease [Acidimicrobiales bacterium]|nr:ABC transporter permease [Acidimicrobiales bacterium]
MTAIWKLLVIGVFSGSIYALASMGVVLTYKTVGVFNLAYGAVAMFCAYTYWQLHDAWHITAWVALPVLLVVVAPVIGLVFERLFRPLSGYSAEVQIVVSLGMLALFQALAPLLYGTQDRPLEPIFPRSTFLVGSLHVGWDQLATLLLAAAIGAGLWWLLRHTRFGTTTRAVVDNGDLAGIIGVNADNVRRTAWIVSSIFAALVGVLLSPTQGLDVYVLTTVVIYAFAPVVLGRLTSLPLAYGGALVLGMVVSVLSKWGSSGTVADIEASIPYVALFVLLVVLAPWLKEPGLSARPTSAAPASGGLRVDASAQRASHRGIDRATVVGLVTLAVALLAPAFLHGPRLTELAAGGVYVVIALTLVVLTGWAGQISLAQFSFVGIGAFTAGHLAGAHGQSFLFAALAGMAIALPFALVVGWVSLRLKGLYLALATMAFALLMDGLVFNRPGLTGGLTGITVPRPRFAGVSFASGTSLYELVVIVAGAVCFAAFFLYRGPIGRRLQILRDSPLAASTLGVNLTVTKLVVFAVCGVLAALGGALYGAVQQSVTPTDFSFGASLELLLLVVLGGRAVISGAVMAGAVYAIQVQHLVVLPNTVYRYLPLAIALGVIGLATNPDGTAALAASETRRVLAVLRPLPRRSGALETGYLHARGEVRSAS